MKKYVSFLLAALVVVLALAGCGKETNESTNKKETAEQTIAPGEYPLILKDGRGKEITLKEKPTRIVSASLAIDEDLLPLVEPERIIAVTKISTDKGISNVADLAKKVDTKIETVTAEQVISLDPDLVIIPTYENPDVVKQLDDAGLTTYQVKDDSSFAGILESLKELGEVTGDKEKAEEMAADAEKRMNELKEKTADLKEKKRVLYWTNSNSSVTGNTTIGEMISLAGGVNVIEEAGITGDDYPDYPNLSKEKLVELNPDVIITSTWQYDGSKATFVEEWKKDPALKEVAAFKNDQVYVINSAHLTTASHFVIEGAEDIYDVLYGE